MAAADADLTLTVAAAEALGYEQLMYFDVPDEAGRRVVARVAGRLPVIIGDELPLRIDPTALYFFDGRCRAI